MDGWWAILQSKNLYPPRTGDIVIEKSIPRILSMLNDCNAKATFFCLGPDVENHPELFQKIVGAGHEIGNHSFNHNHKFGLLRVEEIEEEIKKTHDVIEDKLGVTPMGFRTPNYNVSGRVISCLERRGYKYDSSVLPSFVPGITSFRWLGAPTRPYKPDKESVTKKGNSDVLEMPLSVSPIMRLPISGTFVRVLGSWYLGAGTAFFDSDYMNVNIHPIDVVPEKPFMRGLPINIYWNDNASLKTTKDTIEYFAKTRQPITCEEYYYMHNGG